MAQDLIAERAFYDELFARNPENEHITSGYEELHEMAFPTVPAGPVLDLGCGTGAHAIRLARRGLDVVAADLSLEGVKAARERFRRENLKGRFLVADAENLPFRDNTLAAVWSSLLLHHFPKLDKLPNELARVSRGRVAAVETNAHNALSWFAFNIVNPIIGLSTTTKNQRALWPKRLNRTMSRAGFKVVSMKYIHRAWRDDSSAMGLIRKTYDGISSVLPEKFRANKFLVVYEKA